MLNKISEKVFYMDYVENGDRPVLGLVCGDKYSLIIDGGNSKQHAKEFLNCVSKLNVSPIKYLVLTHWHWDHVFGMNTIGAINIVHKNSNEKLKWMKTLKWTNEDIRQRVENGEEIEFCEEHIKIEYPDNNRDIEIPTPDIVFESCIEIDLGGVIVKAEHLETDHADDCVLINIDDENIVFIGDAMYLDMYNGEYSYTKEKLYPLLDKLNSYNANYYIPAHHPKYSRKEFEEFTNYIKTIGDIVDNSTKSENAIEILSSIKKRNLTEDEIDDIQAFVEGNKKSKDKR